RQRPTRRPRSWIRLSKRGALRRPAPPRPFRRSSPDDPVGAPPPLPPPDAVLYARRITTCITTSTGDRSLREAVHGPPGVGKLDCRAVTGSRSMLQQGHDSPPLSKTIASTATIQLAHPPMLDLFYTPLEERFERITRIARHALRVPVAAITLLNAERQWFKSASGWAIAELPADLSMCRLTVEQNGLQVVPNTKTDPRTAKHPLVVSRPKFRFYAGHPLTDSTGLVAGTSCVFDVKPRHLSDAERACLLDLAALAQREVADEHLRSAHATLTAKLGLARREAMIDPLTKLWNR